MPQTKKYVQPQPLKGMIERIYPEGSMWPLQNGDTTPPARDSKVERVNREAQDALGAISIGATSSLPFITPFVNGPMARIAGDIPFYGGHKSAVARAYAPGSHPDDRMNALFNLAAYIGLDLTTDAGVRGLSLLGSRVGVNVPPAALNVALMAKNQLLLPAYQKMEKNIYDENIGRKTANTIKAVDSFINNGNLQAQYSNVLPYLEAYAAQPTSGSEVIDLRSGVNRHHGGQISGVGSSLVNMLPSNTRPAAKDAISVARDKERGLIKDLNVVANGTSKYASQFVQGLRKDIGMKVAPAAPAVAHAIDDISNAPSRIKSLFGKAMQTLTGGQ